jgi:hypothetical protein
MITPQQWDSFLKDGYLILADFLPPQRREELSQALEKRYALEGEIAGSEGSDIAGVHRLCNLFGKGRAFEELAIEPLFLAAARLAIGDDFRWQAMNFHDPVAGDPRPHQAIHADRSFFPDCTAYLNVVLAVDAMTQSNGATRLVPGSHKRPFPKDLLTDPKQAVDGEIYAACPAGSAILLHGDVWHGGRVNDSDSTRRVIHLGYACPATAPQYDIAGGLSPETRQRLGQHCALIPDCHPR